MRPPLTLSTSPAIAVRWSAGAPSSPATITYPERKNPGDCRSIARRVRSGENGPTLPQLVADGADPRRRRAEAPLELDEQRCRPGTVRVEQHAAGRQQRLRAARQAVQLGLDRGDAIRACPRAAASSC